LAGTHRLGALEPPGRSHERRSNAAPRGMAITPRKRNTEFGLQVHLPYFHNLNEVLEPFVTQVWQNFRARPRRQGQWVFASWRNCGCVQL